MAPPKKKATQQTLDDAEMTTPNPGTAPGNSSAHKIPTPKKTRSKSGLEMPGFPAAVFDAIPAVARKSGVAQAILTQALKKVYVEAANEAVAGVTLTAQDIAREHLAELQAALDEE